MQFFTGLQFKVEQASCGLSAVAALLVCVYFVLFLCFYYFVCLGIFGLLGRIAVLRT